MQEESPVLTLGPPPPPVTRSLAFFNNLTLYLLGLIGLEAESKTNDCRDASKLGITKQGLRESKGVLARSTASVGYMFTVVTVRPGSQDSERGTIKRSLALKSPSDWPGAQPACSGAGACSRARLLRRPAGGAHSGAQPASLTYWLVQAHEAQVGLQGARRRVHHGRGRQAERAFARRPRGGSPPVPRARRPRRARQGQREPARTSPPGGRNGPQAPR